MVVLRSSCSGAANVGDNKLALIKSTTMWRTKGNTVKHSTLVAIQASWKVTEFSVRFQDVSLLTRAREIVCRQTSDDAVAVVEGVEVVVVVVVVAVAGGI